MTPDLSRYRWIVINSSGGKDSQTALRHTVTIATQQGIPTDRLVVAHQDLGSSEWPGSKELAHRQARHYNLRFELSQYRNRKKQSLSLLDYVRRRTKWPDSQNRYCTSEFKRGPGGRIITKLYRESPGDILNVLGFRAAESPARSRRKPFSKNTRFSTKSRTVHDWLPIHPLSNKEVWQDIHLSKVPYHYAYDLGMPRLSCVFCIFAPDSALALAAKHNPELLKEYCQVENEIGHHFQHQRPLSRFLDTKFLNSFPDYIPDWKM